MVNIFKKSKNIKIKIFFLLLFIFIQFIPIIIAQIYSYQKLFISFVFPVILTYFLLILSEKRNKKVKILILFFFPAIAIFFEWLRVICCYLQGISFNEAFFFHFNFITLHETFKLFIIFFLLIFSNIFLIFLLAVKLSAIEIKIKINYINKILLILFFIFSFPLTNPAVYDFFHNYFKIYDNLFSSKYILKKNSKSLSFRHKDKKLNFNFIKEINLKVLEQNIDNIKIFSREKKNIILIYLESFEKIFADNNIFPNLTLNFNNLIKKGLYFDNITQVPGTNWTIAGIVSTQCATPLLVESFSLSGNDLMFNDYLDKAVCLGDILKKLGYYQEYISGTSSKFAGTKNFFLNHGYDKILDKDYIKKYNYKKEWRFYVGFHDNVVFDIAYKEFLKLSKLKKPFNLTISTIDTHAPKGFLAPYCGKYNNKNNSLLDAIHCTDKFLGNFIKNISKHPEFENTLVVILNDHLMFRNIAEKYFPKNYKRTNHWLILNSPYNGIIHKKGTPMDFIPTLLYLMKVNHNVKFLIGQNLLDKNYKKIIYNQKLFNIIKKINTNYLTSNKKFIVGKKLKIILEKYGVYINGHYLKYIYKGTIKKIKFLVRNKLSVLLIFNEKTNKFIEISIIQNFPLNIYLKYFYDTNNIKLFNIFKNNFIYFYIIPNTPTNFNLYIIENNNIIFKGKYRNEILLNIDKILKKRILNKYRINLPKKFKKIPILNLEKKILIIPVLYYQRDKIIKNIELKMVKNNLFKVLKYKLEKVKIKKINPTIPVIYKNNIFIPFVKSNNSLKRFWLIYKGNGLLELRNAKIWKK